MKGVSQLDRAQPKWKTSWVKFSNDNNTRSLAGLGKCCLQYPENNFHAWLWPNWIPGRKIGFLIVRWWGGGYKYSYLETVFCFICVCLTYSPIFKVAEYWKFLSWYYWIFTSVIWYIATVDQNSKNSIQIIVLLNSKVQIYFLY